MIKYYRVPIADVQNYLPKMAEALGHNNVEARVSVDGLEAIMKFDDQNLPEGFAGTAYDRESILIVSQSDLYQVGGDPYIEEEI